MAGSCFDEQMNSKTLISNTAVAAGYFIAGQAGLLLAVPPGNAAAVWPAAGIALAAILISGNKILPGILLGGILVQTTSFLDFSNTEKIVSSLIIGTVVAAGAMCQAWAGARLVNRILERDKALLKERSIVLFCILAGPISCVISASVGIATLWFMEILVVSDLLLAWSTWWIGDTIGVLVFSPVILCFFQTPRDLWRQRILSVAVPLCILITIAFVAFKFAYLQEMKSVENAFEENALRFTHEFQNSVNTHLEAAKDLKEFFDSTTEVSADEFTSFVRPKLSRHPEIKALEWIPKIPHEGRESFEEALGIPISIPNQNGEMGNSPRKDSYTVIRFLEPYKGNENALGFDISSNPTALEAAETACTSGMVSVTDAIRLVQEATKQIGVVFYAPVYEKSISTDMHNDCEALLGLTASVFRLENEISKIHKVFPKFKLSVSLKNQSKEFYNDASKTEQKHSIPNLFRFEREYSLSVANQKWEIIISPASGFVSLYSSWTIWLIIVGGLLISGFSGVGLLMLTGRALQTEELIKQRTLELSDEIIERKNAQSLQNDQQSILELISRGLITLPEILDVIISITEQQLHGARASILFVKEGKFHHGAAPTMPDAFNTLNDGIEIDPSACSYGAAACRSERIIITDVSCDPLCAGFRQQGIEYGFWACWSEPIFNAQGKVVATFTVYHERPCGPSESEIHLIEAMSKLVSIAIERTHTEEELQTLSRAVQASSSAILITNRNGDIEYVNPKFAETTGYSREEVLGQNPRFLKSGETPRTVHADLWETIIAGREWKGEFHNMRKDGSLYWSRTSVSGVKDTNGNIAHFIGIQDDVTHEYELTEQLSYQASHDSLTGLINRREFERRTERLLATIRKDKHVHAMCFVDLDQFKVVNDTCGHSAGDELLRQLGQVLQDTVRHRDTLARLGGDEFGVLMEHCSLDHAHRVATLIQKAIQSYQFIWEGQSFRIGASIGLVAITDAMPNLTELLKQADAACYMAKDLGRNRIHVYQVEDATLVQRHGEMQWVARIYSALRENRFCLYAQAILSLEDHSDVHYEVLIRMLDNAGKTIPPGAFLPAAERYNMVEQLDSWVIENTFRLLAENPDFQNKINFISINLSGQSLTKPDFLQYIISLLDKPGIVGNKICFEITETAAIANLQTAMEFISTLKKLGCRFAMDDFGSGLSSFGYLKNLPVDFLKIDGMFVKNIADDPIDHAMVKSINAIGHIMGMQTIAEFVENDEIKDIVNELGVNYAQGYGIAKPRPLLDIIHGEGTSKTG